MKTDETYNLNAPGSIAAIVYLAVVGPCVFILQPGYVQGLVEYMGFTEAQAGYVASIEMFGLAATTIILNFIIEKFDWRRFTWIFVITCTLGNLLSIGQDTPESLAVIRFITGLGSGGLISITFTMMGLTQRSDRNFGYIVSFVLLYGAFGLLVMPAAFNLVGMNGVLLFFALFCASGMFFINRVPAHNRHNTAESAASSVFSWPIKTVALTGILFYNLGIGIVWVYMFLVGIEAGIAEQTVANAMTLSQFLGIAGAFIAVILEKRIGRMIPLFIGITGGAGGIALLLGEPGFIQYALGVCIFNFLWNLSMPYLMSTLADFDIRGRMVVYGVSMQMIGYAAGPAIAATLFRLHGYDLVNETAITLFIASMILLAPCIRKQYAGNFEAGAAAGQSGL